MKLVQKNFRLQRYYNVYAADKFLIFFFLSLKDKKKLLKFIIKNKVDYRPYFLNKINIKYSNITNYLKKQYNPGLGFFALSPQAYFSSEVFFLQLKKALGLFNLNLVALIGLRNKNYCLSYSAVGRFFLFDAVINRVACKLVISFLYRHVSSLYVPFFLLLKLLCAKFSLKKHANA